MLQRLMDKPAVRDAKGRLPIRALILTPTRELAAQVEESVRARVSELCAAFPVYPGM
jgi:ATP-dependent RNA helicase RhlE